MNRTGNLAFGNKLNQLKAAFQNLWLLSLYLQRDDFPRLAVGLPCEGRNEIPCSLAVELHYGGDWTLFWLAEWLPSGSGSTPVSQTALGMWVPDLQRNIRGFRPCMFS